MTNLNYTPNPADIRVDLFALIVMLCTCFSVCTNTSIETEVYPVVSGPVFVPDRYDSLIIQARQAESDRAYVTGVIGNVLDKQKPVVSTKRTIIIETPYPVLSLPDTIH